MGLDRRGGGELFVDPPFCQAVDEVKCRRGVRDYTTIRKRYMRDSMPIRLGGLAANLARVKSFSNYADNDVLVNSLLDESKYFIEWTAAEADAEVTAELVQLQLQLARWQRKWPSIWADETQRMAMAETAKQWSERVLDLSGLLA